MTQFSFSAALILVAVASTAFGKCPCYSVAAPCGACDDYNRRRHCEFIPEDAAAGMKDASEVFCGTVRSIRRVRANLVVEFEVAKYWKGDDLKKRLAVITPISWIYGNYPFGPDRQYVVYAYRLSADPDNPLRATDARTRTQPFEPGCKEATALNELAEPKTP